MLTQRWFRGLLGGILAALGVLLVAGAVLASVTAETSTAQTGAATGEGQTEQISYGCVEAPINLTDGVTITDFYASVYDNDPLFSADVSLWRVDNITGPVTTMASVGTSVPGAVDAIQVLQTSSIVEPVVLYPEYSYYATICLRSTGIRLYSLRLDVEVPGGVPAENPVIVPAAAFSSDGFLPLTHHFWFGGGYLEGAYAFDLQIIHLPLVIK
jgi:hypothetical protein